MQYQVLRANRNVEGAVFGPTFTASTISSDLQTTVLSANTPFRLGTKPGAVFS
jgi:hypothetical protein